MADERFQDHPSIYPMRDGHAVARSSDFIIYSVEAASIDKVVAEYGPCTFGFFPSVLLIIILLKLLKCTLLLRAKLP